MPTMKQCQGTIHFVLQGKGGVGKSLVATTLLQYLQARCGPDGVSGIDTDPSNQTLAGYSGLPVRQLEILAPGTSRVDEGRFDQLVDWILENSGHIVIDTGATSFLPFSNYLLENDVLHLLESECRAFRIHCPVAGGAAMLDTVDGFRSLAKTLADRSMVVWLNEYFGPIATADKGFEQAKAYTDNQAKVIGLVHWIARNPDTFGRDVRELLQGRRTFDEAIADGRLNIVQRQRLKIVRDAIFEQLDGLYDLHVGVPTTA